VRTERIMNTVRAYGRDSASARVNPITRRMAKFWRCRPKEVTIR
jgi:hypothetical protein